MVTEEKQETHTAAKILGIKPVAYKGNKLYAVRLRVEEIQMTHFFPPIVMRQIRDSFNVDQIDDLVGKILMIPKVAEKITD